MKKIIYSVSLAFSLFTACLSQAQLPILVDSSNYTHYPPASKTKIGQIVTEVLINQHIDLSKKSLYSHVTVKVFGDANHPRLLILLHNRVFSSVKPINVNLNKKLEIISVDKTLKNLKSTYSTAPAHCPDPNIRFLISDGGNTKDNFLKSFANASQQVYSAAIKKYKKNQVKELLGKEATVQNFENYLSCPKLEGIFSSATHDEQGQSFFLYDGDFSYQYFNTQPALNFSKTTISFNTCYAYKKVTPGLCQSITGLSAKRYTGGVTPLLLWGSPETYACFWMKVLNDNATPTKALLNSCAQENDPFAKNSQSPLYIVGHFAYEPTYNYFTIKTNLSSYKVSHDDQYIRLNLAANESIKGVTLTNKKTVIECSGTGSQDLLNKPGLKASEFMLNFDGKTCKITHFKASDYGRLFPQGYTVYGMSPYDQCGNG